MVDLRKFLFHSDYPLEKIVGKVESSITCPAYESREFILPHGLPETPLAVGHWSFNSGFNGHQDCVDLSWQHQFPFVTCSTDRSGVHFGVQNNTDGERRFYARAYLLPPYGSTADYSPPDLGLKWVLNTDLNYFKLVKSGAAGGGSVHHGLGYIPYTLAFVEKGGRWERQTFTRFGGGAEVQIRVNEQDMLIDLTNGTVQYFIYGDA